MRFTSRPTPTTVEHFDRLTALFDRARTCAPSDALALSAALNDAALMIDSFDEPARGAWDGPGRALIAAAARRARESHQLMTDAIGMERDRLGVELEKVAIGTTATAGYAPVTALAPQSRLSRVG